MTRMMAVCLFQDLHFGVLVENLLAFTICSLSLVSLASSKKPCYKTVKENREKYEIKRISIMKKYRARCSESEEYWSPLTGKNCKDKYRVVYMAHKQKSQYTIYRTKQVCCHNEDVSRCNITGISSVNSSSGFSASSLTIITIVVPVVLCSVLLLVTIAMAVVWYKRRKKGLSKNRWYYKEKDSQKKTKGDEKLAEKRNLNPNAWPPDSSLPLSIEVIDSSIPQQQSLKLVVSTSRDGLDISGPQIGDVHDFPKSPSSIDYYNCSRKETAAKQFERYLALRNQGTPTATHPSAPPLNALQT